MTTRKDLQFEVTWLPFFLNANASMEGVNKKEFYVQKFGAERVPLMMERMKQVGASVGISFSYEGVTGNTLHSHRLLHYALAFNKQDEVVNGVFKAYFENAQCIQSLDVLSSIAEHAGLSKDDVRAYLESDKDVEAVRSQARSLVSHYRISGVPYFIVNDKYKFSGAQEVDFWESLFHDISSPS